MIIVSDSITSYLSVNEASRIVIDDSKGMFQIVASLTDDSRGVIHDMFTVQDTGLS